jgi:hypothetical protein
MNENANTTHHQTSVRNDACATVRVGGIHNTNWTETDLIRELAPIRLIQPGWVSSTPDTLSNWLAAETSARLALVLCLWLITVILILRHHASNPSERAIP